MAASVSTKQLREADFRRDDLAGHSQVAAYPMGTRFRPSADLARRQPGTR